MARHEKVIASTFHQPQATQNEVAHLHGLFLKRHSPETSDECAARDRSESHKENVSLQNSR
jgi:hypothetical protein